MKPVLPDTFTTENLKFKQFLSKPFMYDMLFPVYGKHSVTTIFQGWHGKPFYNWSRFTNDNGDILEFYAEGQYVIKARNESNDVNQRQTPKTIEGFIGDMHEFGIHLYWSEWVAEEFRL